MLEALCRGLGSGISNRELKVSIGRGCTVQAGPLRCISNRELKEGETGAEG